MQHNTIWFDSPADGWLRRLPIGNGHIGGMPGGDPAREVICLNDDTLWSGYPRDYTKPDFQENLRLSRALLLQNRRAEAEEIIETRLTNRFTQAYLPLGDLIVETQAGRIERYRRALDLNTAIHTTRYLHDGAQMESECFVSFPADTLLYQIVCESARDFRLSFASKLACEVFYDAAGFTASITAPSDLIIGDVGNFYSEKNRMVYDEQAFATHCSVRLALRCDGIVRCDSNGIDVKGATKLAVALCSATDFSKGEAYAQYAQQRAHAALARTFAQVKDEHLRDHAALFARVSLDLYPAQADVSCTDRLNRMRLGEASADDFSLLFQYGRYLLIASSREGTQAANLQGIWNQDLIPPWWSGYTLNINLQMNYWLADRTNLGDCFEPLAAYTRRLCEAGKRTAALDYGVSGSVAHHQSDIWAHSTPVGLDRERIPLAARWMMWNMPLPWLSLQLFDHYAYSRDVAFLSDTLYPVMRETAMFLKNTFTRTENGLCNIPSTSPENMYVDADGTPRAVCQMSSMDIALSKEFSLAFAQVCEWTGDTAEAAFWRAFSQEVREYSVMENQTLREWDADVAQTEEGHRHFSMLFGVYPGESLLGSAFMEAARKALRQRLNHGSGHTGWSAVWAALLLARFGEGDAAYALLLKLMRENIHDNLFGAHPPELFQIDANFGFTIALTELLLQQTHGVVRLLPALPRALSSGEITGVLVHGGHAFGFGWKDGVLEWLTIDPVRDETLSLQSEDLSRLGLCTSAAGECCLTLRKGERQCFGERMRSQSADQ